MGNLRVPHKGNQWLIYSQSPLIRPFLVLGLPLASQVAFRMQQLLLVEKKCFAKNHGDLKTGLGGVFKHLLFSPLPGEMIQFD